MATWSVQKFWIRAVARWGIMGKTLNVELLQTCFVIEDFGSNTMGIAIGNAWRLLVLKVRRDFILDGLLVQNVANIQSVNALICEFGIQKRAVPCFCRFTDPDSVEKPVWRNIQNNTLKSMSGRSKMQGQGGLIRNVAVSMAESTVLYEYGEDPTVNWRTTRAHRTRQWATSPGTRVE